jgi:hypothetical protein
MLRAEIHSKQKRSIESARLYTLQVFSVQSTARHGLHLQFDITDNALEIRAIQSVKFDVLTVQNEWDSWKCLDVATFPGGITDFDCFRISSQGAGYYNAS